MWKLLGDPKEKKFKTLVHLDLHAQNQRLTATAKPPFSLMGLFTRFPSIWKHHSSQKSDRRLSLDQLPQMLTPPTCCLLPRMLSPDCWDCLNVPCGLKHDHPPV